MAKDYRHSKDDWHEDDEDTNSRAKRKQKFRDIDIRRKHKLLNKEDEEQV